MSNNHTPEEKLCKLRNAVLKLMGLPDDKGVLLMMAQEMNNTPGVDPKLTELVVALIETL